MSQKCRKITSLRRSRLLIFYILFVVLKFLDEFHVFKCVGRIVENSYEIELECTLYPIKHLHLQSQKLGLAHTLQIKPTWSFIHHKIGLQIGLQATTLKINNKKEILQTDGKILKSKARRFLNRVWQLFYVTTENFVSPCQNALSFIYCTLN